MTLSKTRFFLNIENEEKWLNQMANDGFRFTGKRGFIYDFLKEDNTSYRYFLDQRLFLTSGQSKKYRDFMKELQLKFILKRMGKYYFEADSSCDVTSFYTDKKAKIYFYLRRLLVLICIGIINICILINAKGPYLLKIENAFSISIPVVANTIMLCGVVVAVCQYISYIVKIKNKG